MPHELARGDTQLAFGVACLSMVTDEFEHCRFVHPSADPAAVSATCSVSIDTRIPVDLNFDLFRHAESVGSGA
jgi:hypothetical protein